MLDEGMLAPQMQTLPKNNGILPHKHATKSRRSCLFPGLDVGWQAWNVKAWNVTAWNVTSNEEHFMDRLLIWHWSRYQPLLTHSDGFEWVPQCRKTNDFHDWMRPWGRLLRPTWNNDTQADDKQPLNTCQKNFGAELAVGGVEALSWRRKIWLNELSNRFCVTSGNRSPGYIWNHVGGSTLPANWDQWTIPET